MNINKIKIRKNVPLPDKYGRTVKGDRVALLSLMKVKNSIVVPRKDKAKWVPVLNYMRVKKGMTFAWRSLNKLKIGIWRIKL